MISGLDLNATVDYVSKLDNDNPTIWKIGVIPSYLFARLSADGVNKGIETAYKILQVTIKGWDNFNIPFETVKQKIYEEELTVIPLTLLSKIPLKIISELAAKAMEVNQITEQESKN